MELINIDQEWLVDYGTASYFRPNMTYIKDIGFLHSIGKTILVLKKDTDIYSSSVSYRSSDRICGVADSGWLSGRNTMYCRSSRCKITNFDSTNATNFGDFHTLTQDYPMGVIYVNKYNREIPTTIDSISLKIPVTDNLGFSGLNKIYTNLSSGNTSVSADLDFSGVCDAEIVGNQLFILRSSSYPTIKSGMIDGSNSIIIDIYEIRISGNNNGINSIELTLINSNTLYVSSNSTVCGLAYDWQRKLFGVSLFKSGKLNSILEIPYNDVFSNINASCKIDGTWKDIDKISVKIDGSWKSVDSVYIKVDGNWKKSE